MGFECSLDGDESTKLTFVSCICDLARESGIAYNSRLDYTEK